jgi:hypothetical protein
VCWMVISPRVSSQQTEPVARLAEYVKEIGFTHVEFMPIVVGGIVAPYHALYCSSTCTTGKG